MVGSEKKQLKETQNEGLSAENGAEIVELGGTGKSPLESP